MRGSYPCDLFHADYTDFGLTPRPDQNSYSKPTLQQPPSVPSDPPPKKEASKIHKNAEAEEAERLLSRYTEAEQTEIAEVFKLLATTRKGGRIANSSILNCLRVWDTIDANWGGENPPELGRYFQPRFSLDFFTENRLVSTVIPACFWRESSPVPCSLDSRQKHAGMTKVLTSRGRMPKRRTERRSILDSEFRMIFTTPDVNRVLYGIRIYQDRGLHLVGKKEPYLEAIMLNAVPAQIARKQSNTARGEQLAASEIGSATIS